MPFPLPQNQAEALKDARKISDLLRRFETRHGHLFLDGEQQRLAETVLTLKDLQTALRVPPEILDQ